jgi:hypothetical protein
MTQIEIQARKEYRIFGLQRSGNNAVIGWIIKATATTMPFLKATNCSFVNNGMVFVPFDRGTGWIEKVSSDYSILAANSWHLFDPSCETIFRLSAKRNVMNGEVSDEEWSTNNEHPKWDRLLRQNVNKNPLDMVKHVEMLNSRGYYGLLSNKLPTNLEAVIFHVEDFPVALTSDIPFNSSPIRTNANEVVEIFVLRDFRNWVASRIKSGRNVDQDVVSLWKDFYELFREPGRAGEKVLVNFNLLKDDSEYRKRIAAQLALDWIWYFPEYNGLAL